MMMLIPTVADPARDDPSARFKRGTVKIGRLAGARVEIHWSAALAAAVLAALLVPFVGAGPAVAAVFLYFVSVLTHEGGHVSAASRFGFKVDSVSLHALGGVARLRRAPMTPAEEMVVAAAGPIASALTTGAAFLMTIAADRIGLSAAWVAVFRWTMYSNAALAAVNLLPGSPLDGGRVLRAWRWAGHRMRWKASIESGCVGIVLGLIAAAAVGLADLTLPLRAALLAAAGFVVLSALAEIKDARPLARLRDLTVREVTTFGIAHASPWTNVEAMLWDRTRMAGTAVVAIIDRGKFLGLVPEKAMWALGSGQRRATALYEIMVPVRDLTTCDADASLSDVMERVNWDDTPLIAVMDDSTVIGVVGESKLHELNGSRW